MLDPRARIRRTADTLLGVRGLDAVARRVASGRARSMVLIWHRVGPDGPQVHEVVRTVPLRAFEAQLDLLASIGDVVPLSELERPGDPTRTRFALTFDDDDPGHHRSTLPALRARGLPATFFLSGRWLHGHGPYWWELLEERIRRDGLPATNRAFGQPADLSAVALGVRLTGTDAAFELTRSARERGGATMDTAGARELAAAGCEIGFHTLDHEPLTLLADAEIDRVVTEGRATLADALSVPVRRFAYPHGMADDRVAARVAAAGFEGAWTTTKRLADPADPPMLQGRFDLGHLPPSAFRGRLLRTLVRPAA